MNLHPQAASFWFLTLFPRLLSRCLQSATQVSRAVRATPVPECTGVALECACWQKHQSAIGCVGEGSLSTPLCVWHMWTGSWRTVVLVKGRKGLRKRCGAGREMRSPQHRIQMSEGLSWTTGDGLTLRSARGSGPVLSQNKKVSNNLTLPMNDLQKQLRGPPTHVILRGKKFPNLVSLSLLAENLRVTHWRWVCCILRDGWLDDWISASAQRYYMLWHSWFHLLWSLSLRNHHLLLFF